MPTNTPNLNLTTYDISTEGSVLFISAWENLIGTLSTSNMNKLDGFAGTTTATLQLLQDRPGSTHISATTADGVNYTATVSGLTSLSSGMIIYLEPDDVNTGNPYLNINSLGNKTMYKIDVDGVAVQLEPGDLIPTRKILLVYDGFSWYATGGVNLSDYKISGAINSLIAIGSSNQPVASSIVLSGGKIGAESIKFDSTLNKDVNNNLMLGDSGITAGIYKGTTYDKYGRATASSGKVDGSSEVRIEHGVTDNLVSINSTDGIVDSGYSPSSFSLSTHNHSGTYLPIGGKAADSDKLDSIDSTGFVQTANNQTVGGIKTFTSIPVLPATNPTAPNEAVRKGYADATYINAITHATKNAVQAIPHSTTTKLSWSTVSRDDLVMWNYLAPTRLTVATAGYYDIFFYAQLEGSVSGEYSWSCLYVNNLIVHYAPPISVNQYGNQLTLNFRGEYDVGDYFEIGVNHNFGSSKNIVVSILPVFSAIRIG